MGMDLKGVMDAVAPRRAGRTGRLGRPQTTPRSAFHKLIMRRDMLHDMKLSAFDLNHARALHILLEEAHVARAARRLGITPAAASNALHRLRREFNDPLLILVGRTFARTALAEELRGPAREVVAAAGRLVDAAVPFDPATYDGIFVFWAADRIAEVLVRPIDRALASRAPRATLQVRTFAGSSGSIGPEERGLFVVPAFARGMLAEPLFTEEYVCVMRAGHPLLEGPLTMQRFADAEHILVGPRAESARGVVDDALARHGLTRRVSRVLTSFTMALALVESTDRIVTLPSSFVTFERGTRELVFRKPPVDLAPLQMQVAWPLHQEGDPRYNWFRALVQDVVRATGLEPGAAVALG